MNLRSIYLLAFLHVVLYNVWQFTPNPWDVDVIVKNGHTTINLYRNTVFDVCQGLSVLLAMLWPTFRRLSFIDMMVYVMHCSFLAMDVFDTASNGDYGNPMGELMCYGVLMLFPALLKLKYGDVDKENWRVWVRRLRCRR